jgi:hypothetical protein
MSRIGPRVTCEELAKSAEQIARGEGLIAGLPGVKADARSMDAQAHKANRDLAERIREAMAAVKPTDKDVPRFVLGWRLYPNRNNPFWDDAGGTHVCGCGCGCSSCPPPEDR